MRPAVWAGRRRGGRHCHSAKALGVGTVLGERYEIVKLLEQGGMDAVYPAHDREREVALKVIRSDMAANPEILWRFKQELILAW